MLGEASETMGRLGFRQSVKRIAAPYIATATERG
jgi:hypothetical protein